MIDGVSNFRTLLNLGYLKWF